LKSDPEEIADLKAKLTEASAVISALQAENEGLRTLLQAGPSQLTPPPESGLRTQGRPAPGATGSDQWRYLASVGRLGGLPCNTDREHDSRADAVGIVALRPCKCGGDVADARHTLTRARASAEEKPLL
jgi:hypothetical protein